MTTTLVCPHCGVRWKILNTGGGDRPAACPTCQTFEDCVEPPEGTAVIRCFFADTPTAGACDGQLIRGHLIPRQVLRREFPHGVVLDDGRWRKLGRNEDRYDLLHHSVADLIDDPRSWVPMCGGPMGNSGHHGMLDTARTLRIKRERLPEGFLLFCDELGLTWFIERIYSTSESEAA